MTALASIISKVLVVLLFIATSAEEKACADRGRYFCKEKCEWVRAVKAVWKKRGYCREAWCRGKTMGRCAIIPWCRFDDNQCKRVTDVTTGTPSSDPTASPTSTPSEKNTVAPSSDPTASPTLTPSEKATLAPSSDPTASPTSTPSEKNTVAPSSNGAEWSDGTLCGLGTTCNNCKNKATYWYGKALTACGREPCWGDGTRCLAGTSCNSCCNRFEWWDGPFGHHCGKEPCWRRGKVCGAGTTCNSCCSGADCPWYQFGVCNCK